jgi:hypothetical protein
VDVRVAGDLVCAGGRDVKRGRRGRGWTDAELRELGRIHREEGLAAAVAAYPHTPAIRWNATLQAVMIHADIPQHIWEALRRATS